ncbi:DUF4235 domain-containing protein [Streptomyces adustus]|uniref:DUF4235 domain-containing protein n=1 Tax=Streptomyces adustus TaxID=1609272 RepID=A0A5N8V3V2_9ACTN|nr:DUF4235 domain-containing protein [Streptomyces adustus]MPY29827.1 DUF4235 domain-containing protein [Streptomyces adustus]
MSRPLHEGPTTRTPEELREQRDGDAPDATDEERAWAEILAAAVLQGAVFGGVKAAVERGGATATRRLTGTWPG